LHRVPFPLAGFRGEPIIRPVDRFQTAWLPVIACATLIFVLSGIPSLSTGLGTWDLGLRKLAHVTIYALLGALLLRALERQLASVAAGIAYAVSDELHQHFIPGRSGAPLDVVFDALGICVGVAALRWLRR
jgi:VanZ like family